MIQGLPEVLNDVADEHPKACAREVISGIDEAVLVAFCLDIDKGIRVIREPGDGLSLEGVEVLIRPVELVSMAHSATL
jgi:hypothetical protein